MNPTNDVIEYTDPGQSIGGFVVGHCATVKRCAAIGTIAAVKQEGNAITVTVLYDTPQPVDAPEGATATRFELDWRWISSTWKQPDAAPQATPAPIAPKPMPSDYVDEVAVCIDCMLQDDARGETIVFTRKDGHLIPQVVPAKSIDLDNLGQYEIILFDGGNSAGDTWKQTFFPNQMHGIFVDENPLPKVNWDTDVPSSVSESLQTENLTFA